MSSIMSIQSPNEENVDSSDIVKNEGKYHSFK